MLADFMWFVHKYYSWSFKICDISYCTRAAAKPHIIGRIDSMRTFSV